VRYSLRLIQKIIPIVIVFSLYSCKKKVFISDEIIQFINKPYKNGDVLIFQNIQTNQKDTTLITNIEVFHQKYDWFRHDGYQPQYASVWYKNKNLRYGYEFDERIISSEKRKPNDETFLAISYLGSSFYMDQIDFQNQETITLKLTNRTFKNVFNPKPIFLNNKAVSPKHVFWDEEFGLIMYIAENGNIWERINWY